MKTIQISKGKVLRTGLLAFALSVTVLATNADAATSVARLTTLVGSASGKYVNVHDGTANYTATNTGNYSMSTAVRRAVAALPDPSVYTRTVSAGQVASRTVSVSDSTYYAYARQFAPNTTSGRVGVSE